MSIYTTTEVYTQYSQYIGNMNIQRSQFIDYAGGKAYMNTLTILNHVRTLKDFEELETQAEKSNWLLLTTDPVVDDFTISSKAIIDFMKKGYEHFIIDGYLAEKIYLENYIRIRRKESPDFSPNVWARGRNVNLPLVLAIPKRIDKVCLDEFEVCNTDYLCMDADGMIQIPFDMLELNREELKAIISKILKEEIFQIHLS